ncbi:hypothetical protein QUF70_15970 [Desulfobacterales bacterium HSG17]|nr:hypothetical protein [Desulfobacterales bacterium HSG17]
MNKKIEEQIQNEIRKLVIEKDFSTRREKEQSEQISATIEALMEITDLSREEISNIANKVRNKHVKKRITGKLIIPICAAGLCILLCIFYILFMEIQKEPVLKQPNEGPSEPLEKKGLEDFTRINVSLNNFSPTGMNMRIGGRATSILSETKPDHIKRVPKFKGNIQKYGFLKLGNTKNNKFYYVFDLISGSSPVLYIDINQNNDLSDDGAPRINKGSGWFGTAIFIPFKRLDRENNFQGNCRIWLFTKKKFWDAGEVKHYTWTQLKGKVRIDNENYDAYIADSGNHDADFTNDSVCLDINIDKKINYQKECFKQDSFAYINNKKYLIKINH